ncbi:hypothetical protein PLESTB_000989500 [Pleodorina starrii]|uniref:Myosin motor domain-containing protein n=1 Tax=Pleodorina starrii TaxID=330485 RepID=A0A9W6BPD4_9CHLO|nr:hypothetical protein PLESTM_000552200 [Pleodorina starrii]GLC55460.1 hypothetical protein PLESTB_000989500 [Pleodorina starrii]GLC73852.1 hypothetical protein PLESTF_001427900 [Pleodorina starrii]
MAAGIGARVWVPRETTGWAQAVVISCDGPQLCVRRDEDGQEDWLDSSQAYLCNNDDVEDMTTLSFLHEPGVLWNLQRRYARCDIYTYTGSILIAVNPFKPVPKLYGNHVIEQYRSQERRQPHVYATACAAFHNMMRDGAGQAILVTGESGAGKTETAKLIMACLTHLGAQHGSRRSSAGATQVPGVSGVEQKILESNPLLEAFGNAKTLRNNNSSRFGKYVEIFFDPAAGGAVTGAAVRTYLLERSRVVAVNNPERSFHIFYQLVYGASPADRAAWRLPESASGFAYLARSSCFELPGQSNAEEYQHTRCAMSHIGLSEQQQSAVLSTVAAVLHLGNVTFVDTDGEGAAVAGGAAREALEAAAELLGVDPLPLAEALTTRQIQTREGPIATPLSAQAAADARDSMAKVVYARLFEWLVSAVNAAVDEAHNGASGSGSSGGALGRRHLSIGLLDIYGFESFEVNDLEQLCINLTNEKLQQHFNQHVFKWEQAEYEREGVDWSYISFRDNADVLDLLEGRLGLMDLLDELCRFPKATAEDLAHKYRSSSAVSANSRFTRLNRPATAFGIDHYAGSVTYSTQNFLDKNRDYVVAEHQSLLGRSHQPLLQELFAPETPTAGEAGNGSGAPSGPGPRSQSQFQFRSVSSQCRKQLAELMAALSQLQPHYVRCIKPNPSGAAGEFNAPYSLHQLRCGGVMEAVRIACAGYSYRRPYAAFLEHFWQLCPEPVHALRRRLAEQQPPQLQQDPSLAVSDLATLEVAELQAAAATVMAAAGLDPSGGVAAGAGPQYHLGHTKVFLRSTAAAALEGQRLAAMNTAATVIQAHFRRCQMQRWYQGVRRAVITIQACCRGLLARREAQRRREEWAAVAIQRAWRGCVERLHFQRMRHAAVVLQAMWRGVLTRRAVEGMRLERAALVLQTAWRCIVIRREYLYTLRYWRAALRIQTAWRGYAARQLYLQILPLHRAALVIQRVWRAHRRGEQLVERLRTALLQYWIYSRAVVVIQAAWRGEMARRLAARLRRKQRRARLLAAFSAVAGDSQQPPRPSPDISRRKDVCTPTSGPRKCSLMIGGSGCKGYGGALLGPTRSAEHTPVAGEVVRADDLASQPDRDVRVRARLVELQDFKVSPLVQYWQKQEAAAADGALAAARRAHSARRSTSGTVECGRPLGRGAAHGSPMSGGASSCADLSSLPGSPMDADFPIVAEELAKANITRGRGRGRHVPAVGDVSSGGSASTADDAAELGSGALSCEPSYGQLLCVRHEDDGSSGTVAASG